MNQSKLDPSLRIDFISSLERVGKAINHTAQEKGFWEGPRNEGEMVALEHSELSEALEAIRHGNPASEKIPGFTQVEEEYADAVIRILDHCIGLGYRLPQAIIAKMAYNDSRPFKHGKQF